MGISRLSEQWIEYNSKINIDEFDRFRDKQVKESYLFLRDIVFVSSLTNSDKQRIARTIEKLYNFAGKLNGEFAESLKNFVAICELCFTNDNISTISNDLSAHVPFTESSFGLRSQRAKLELISAQEKENRERAKDQKRLIEEMARIAAQKKVEEEKAKEEKLKRKKEQEAREAVRIRENEEQTRHAAQKKVEAEKAEQKRIREQESRERAQRRAYEDRLRRQRIEEEKRNDKSALIRLFIVSIPSMLYLYSFIADGMLYSLNVIWALFIFIGVLCCYWPSYSGNKFYKNPPRTIFSTLRDGDDILDTVFWMSGIFFAIIFVGLFIPFINVIVYTLIAAITLAIIGALIGVGLHKYANRDSYEGVFWGTFCGGVLTLMMIFLNIGVVFSGDKKVYTTTGDSEKCIGIDYDNGDKYRGKIEPSYFNFKGIPHGEGTFIYSATGDYYIGKWKGGHRSGTGILYSKNGSIKQQGIWLNDELISEKVL